MTMYYGLDNWTSSAEGMDFIQIDIPYTEINEELNQKAFLFQAFISSYDTLTLFF